VRAIRVKTSRLIAPFGDAPRDLYVATQTVAQWQEQACKACGLQLQDVESVAEIDDQPAIVFFDDVFFSEMALRNFVADAMVTDKNIALAVSPSANTEALAPASKVRTESDGSTIYDVFAVCNGQKFKNREELQTHCEPKLQRHRAMSVSLRLPKLEGGPRELQTEITARVVAHVHHWLHLLRLSQMAIGIMILDRLRKEPTRALRMKWKRRFGLERRVHRNFIDPTAQVHPTAYLDTVVVGPGCVIGPHAHVHHSVLGAGTVIGDHAAVMGCAFAENVHVLRASYLAHCAAMPEANLASYKVQLSLFGKNSFLTSSAKLLDAKFRGEVSVQHEDSIISVGSAFLGACLGHRVVLGADTTIQSGRAIPNGVTIVTSPEYVVSRADFFEEGTLLTVRDGNLIQLTAPKPDSSPE
jgi:carbonic anhydrase/acetyltransferase-like protein (isoleucine patch superfamily)